MATGGGLGLTPLTSLNHLELNGALLDVQSGIPTGSNQRRSHMEASGGNSAGLSVPGSPINK